MTKMPALVLHECRTQQTRVLWMGKLTDEDYGRIGRWVVENVASMTTSCRKANTTPCIHITPRRLNKDQFEKLDRVDWQLEKGKLIRDVERGRTQK